MEDNTHLPELVAALSRNWGLDPKEDMAWSELESALAGALSELITRDFERLVQTMYRLDVDEGKFAAAMACSSVNEQASALGKIVLQRELQRLEFRKKYRQRGNEQT